MSTPTTGPSGGAGTGPVTRFGPGRPARESLRRVDTFAALAVISGAVLLGVAAFAHFVPLAIAAFIALAAGVVYLRWPVVVALLREVRSYRRRF